MKKQILNIVVAALVILSLTACEDNDSNSSGGTPVVRYVRPCDVAASDSLLSSAYLGSKIAIIGESLQGVNKIYFNDQKASLNPNMVTDNAIIVSIPTTIPGLKEDLIKLYTDDDSCYFSFETEVPVPTVRSMSCEYVSAGEIAHINGLYFVNDENSPLTVTFTGGVEGEIQSYDVNNIDVVVPDDAESGPITVTSVYGSGESSFQFRDQRNIILDFDTVFPDGGYNHGWHGGSGYGTDEGLDGQYLIFTGNMDDDTWDDSHFGYERWTYRESDPDFFDTSNLEDYELKFEVNIPDVWSSSALQIIFTGAEEVWMNWQETSTGGNVSNAYVSDASYPRALWIPWTDAASYTTNGWITVTIPMTDFKYNGDGEEIAMKGAGHYSGITLFVNGGGVTGTACTPTFHIDNVRVVPID